MEQDAQGNQVYWERRNDCRRRNGKFLSGVQGGCGSTVGVERMVVTHQRNWICCAPSIYWVARARTA